MEESLQDLQFIDERDWKKFLRILERTKRQKKSVLVRVHDEKQLVHALEKSHCKYILGSEKVHHKDSVHYVRSGLDLGILRTAKRRGKTICFSFCDFTKESKINLAGRLLARMKQSMALCRKEKVDVEVRCFCGSSKCEHDPKQIKSFERVVCKR